MTRAKPPYLLISLGLHAAVLLSMLFIRGPQLPEVRQRRVVVELAPRREIPKLLEARPEPEPAEILATDAQPLSGSLDLAGPRSLAVPSGRLPREALAALSDGRVSPSGGPAAGRLGLQAPQSSRTAVAPQVGLRLPTPAPDDILADLPAPSRTAAQSLALPAAEPTAGYLDSGALEWRGRERKVLKAARPEFPEVLLQEAQEVDVEATFKVAPNGQVTQVEILRSSGYSTVDRAVERALADYLFEASATDQEDTGRIKFRFRLERVN